MTSPVVLVVDDDASILTVLKTALQRAGFEVRTAGTAKAVDRWIDEGIGDVLVMDVILPDENTFNFLPRIKHRRPDMPVLVMSAQNTILTAIRATEYGAYEYLPKPFDLDELVASIERALAPVPVRNQSNDSAEFQESESLPLIGRSAPMQEIYRVIARLMNTDLTVMISGESGTGKELVARALHDYGRRRAGPFVAVNMAAIPRDLIENELFGHERGSFTGATGRTAGRFEQARGGTLFLDEIGDMPMDAQTRLLRVLQDGEYMIVGGQTTSKTDVRIIAATHRDLRGLIARGQFREDLYYRLNVVPLRLPPLRDRREDIPDLVAHFLRRAELEELGAKTIEQSAVDALVREDWPGNVRELENFIRRLVAIASGDVITEESIAAHLRPSGAAGGGMSDSLSDTIATHIDSYFSRYSGKLPPPGLYERALSEFEKPLLKRCLKATQGNQVRAAQVLGLNRNTLRKKLRQLEIEPARESDANSQH